MSPEQARGDIVDGRSDIFSLGIILDEMVSGEHPFSKPTPAETLTSVLRDSPPPVRVTPKSADASVAQILQKSLAKDPVQRYQRVTELALDIRKLQSELAAGGLIFRRWARIAGSMLLAAIVFIAFWRFVLRPKETTPPTTPIPISVLVADFRNLTGDPDFNDTLEQPMGISLEGAPYISVYKHPQAHSVASKLSPSADGRLDTERALLVSRREGINAVVEALIKPNGKDYTISVQALDPATGKKVQPINQASARLLEGEMSLRKGDAAGAVRLFREAQSLVDTWLGRFSMGCASIEAGAFTEAYTEFDLCLKRRGEATSVFMNDLPSYRYFPPVYYYLGRVQEGLKSPAAKESYQTFIKIKEKSTGAPLVDDARRRPSALKKS